MSTKKEEETMNLYQKLAKVRKSVEVVAKNKSGFNYKYVSDDELLSRISGLMDKYNLSLVPEINYGTMEYYPYTYVNTKVNKQTHEPYDVTTSEILVKADMTFRWINNENPEEFVSVPWALIGQQADASQAFGSALSYCNRYFLLKYFNVATPEDDVDNWRSKQKEAAQSEEREIASRIVSEIDSVIREYLAEHADKSKDVKDFCAKYVKGGDYNKITDPELAAHLFDNFKNTFIEVEEK